MIIWPMVTHVLVTSRLDYKVPLKMAAFHQLKLQLVPNAAARLLARTNKRVQVMLDETTPRARFCPNTVESIGFNF